MSHPSTIAALAAAEGGEVTTPWDHVRRVVKMMTIARYWAGASNKATPVATEQWWVDLERLSAVYPPSIAADILAESPSKRAVKSAKVAPLDKALLFSIAPSPVPSPPGSEEGGGGGGDEEEDDEAPKDLMGRLKEAAIGGPPESKTDWALHFFSIIPKVACAFIPNADLLGGYPCFVLSIAMVGLITFFVQESARSISCAMGIPQSVAAIMIVALGTSLPDTLASRAAALADETADASVGNITGSNSVNIFLGLGLPWTVGAIYWTAKGFDGMPVPDIGLGYSVLVFEILAVICLGGFGFRRWRFGYELGGRGKYTTGLVFGSLWVLFITLSSIYLMHDIKMW